MTDFSKATPRPWHEKDGYVLDNNGHWVATSTSDDAPLIFEAVNSYDAMKARIAGLEAIVAADLVLLDHCAHLHFGAMINPKRDIHDAALALKPLMNACYAARRAALGEDRAG